MWKYCHTPKYGLDVEKYRFLWTNIYILILNCGNLANYESRGFGNFLTRNNQSINFVHVCCLIRYWEVLILNDELWMFTWDPNFPRSVRLLDFCLGSAFDRACKGQRASMKKVTHLVGQFWKNSS